MSDTLFSLPSIGPGPEYRERHIWLPQLALEAARDGHSVIENRSFVGCTLEGPTVIAAIEGCNFDGCFFGETEGEPGSLLLHTLGERSVVGVIPFKNCLFKGSNFRAVGFTGSADFLSHMLKSLRETSA